MKSVWQEGAYSMFAWLGGSKPEGESSSTPSQVESKKLKVDPVDSPDEKNDASAGCHLTQEIIDFFYQQSKEVKRYKRKYEEAAYGRRNLWNDPLRSRSSKVSRKNSRDTSKRSSTVWSYVIGAIF